METSEDRGIECKGLCFNYVDGQVTLSMYQNPPGVRRDLCRTIFQKSFSPDEWSEINHYLMGALDKAEGIFVDEEEEEVSIPIVPSLTQQGLVPPILLTADIAAKDVELPKVNNIPKMTEDDKKEENGTE